MITVPISVINGFPVQTPNQPSTRMVPNTTQAAGKLVQSFATKPARTKPIP